MNKLLLSCPIPRAVRVQRPVTCYRLLNKSFSTTTCRKFGTTSIQRTEGEKNPPLPAQTDFVQNDVNLCELSGPTKVLFSVKDFFLLICCSTISSAPPAAETGLVQKDLNLREFYWATKKFFQQN